MSRSGYTDDCEHLNLYRANVDRSLASKRGQEFLRELASAMDAMPEKKLIAKKLIDEQGQCCTIGVVCKARNIDVSTLCDDDPWQVSKAVGLSRVMAAEIAYMNDEWNCDSTPEERWHRMRKWVDEQINPRT